MRVQKCSTNTNMTCDTKLIEFISLILTYDLKPKDTIQQTNKKKAYQKRKLECTCCAVLVVSTEQRTDMHCLCAQFDWHVCRVSCLLLVAIGVLWVPIIQNVAGSQLFTYMQQVQNILSPPVSAVFLLAVFWPRTNEPVRHSKLISAILLYLFCCSYQCWAIEELTTKFLLDLFHYMLLSSFVCLFIFSLSFAILLKSIAFSALSYGRKPD